MKLVSLLKNNHRAALGLTLLGLMTLLFSSFVATVIVHYESGLQQLNLLQWALLFLLSAFTMTLAMTPSTFVALVGGYFLGWQATVFMLVAYFLASFMGYQAGRLLDGGRLILSLQQHPKFVQFLDGLRLQEWPLMILVRLSPVLPFSIMNLLMPALNIRLSVFLLAGFVGMLPRTLFSIWLGIQSRELMMLFQSPSESGSYAAFMILLAVVSTGGILWMGQSIVRQKIIGNNSNSMSFD